MRQTRHVSHCKPEIMHHNCIIVELHKEIGTDPDAQLYWNIMEDNCGFNEVLGSIQQLPLSCQMNA